MRVCVSLLAAGVGCTERVEPPGGRDGLGRVEEGSPEAELILRAANELSLEVLDDEVPLDSRAATNLVETRSGPDGVDGTGDDTPFQTVAEVDAVPYVGAAGLDALLAYATALWGGELVHGLAEGSPEGVLILDVANTTTHHLLQTRVGLADLAACAIVDARVGPDGLDDTADDTPFLTLAELDDADWIDGAAFEALLAYGRALAPAVECPTGYIVSSDGKSMFTSLNSAISASADGATLDVCAGTFTVGSTLAPKVDLILRGRGVGVTTIDGADLELGDGVTMTIEGLSFDGKSHEGSGGAITTLYGSTLIVRDSEFVNHRGFNVNGGVISASGTLELDDVSFDNNSVNGIKVGGAIYVTGVLIGERVSFTDNSAWSGGAIYSSGGDVTLIDSELLRNHATNGGGVYLIGSGTTFSAEHVDFGSGETENSSGDVVLYTGNTTAFYYGQDVSVECDENNCI